MGNIKSCITSVPQIDQKKVLEDDFRKIYHNTSYEFDIEYLNIVKKMLEERKKIPDKIEERLARNPFTPQIKLITNKNAESCSICWCDIPEINNDSKNINDCDISEFVICDGNKIICIDCAINLISNCNYCDSYVGENKVPGFMCPFYNEDKLNHDHRYNIPSLGLLLSQIAKENKIIEIHEAISQIISKYMQENIDNNVREISKEICKEDTDSLNYITNKIKNEIFTDICPSCKRKCQFIEGCMSILCKNEDGLGCNKYYCSVCLEYSNNSKFCTDEHVEKCIKNNALKGDYGKYFSMDYGYDWRMFQRISKIKKYILNNNFVVPADIIIKKLHNDPALNELQLYLKIKFPNYV
jgi:hypothetical protein